MMTDFSKYTQDYLFEQIQKIQNGIKNWPDQASFDLKLETYHQGPASIQSRIFVYTKVVDLRDGYSLWSGSSLIDIHVHEDMIDPDEYLTAQIRDGLFELYGSGWFQIAVMSPDGCRKVRGLPPFKG